MRAWDRATPFHVFCRLFALLLLALTPMVVLANGGDHEQGNGKDVTGAWLITVGSGPGKFLVLLSFMEDGNLITSAQGENAALTGNPSLSTAGHGVWHKSGAKTFVSTAVLILYDEKGALTGTLKVTQVGALNDSGNVISGNSVGLIKDPDGNVVQTDFVTFEGRRISVGPL
jgi:hypothetical protein